MVLEIGGHRSIVAFSLEFWRDSESKTKNTQIVDPNFWHRLIEVHCCFYDQKFFDDFSRSIETANFLSN